MKSTNRRRRVLAFTLPILLVATATFASPAPQEKMAQQAKDTAKKTGTAITDSWITVKVHSQFVPEDTLEGSDIDVDTQAGVVTLNGTVAAEAGRARAIAIAKATDGVTSVTDHLRIAAPEASMARDAGRKTAEATRETGQATKDAVGTTGKAVTDGWIKSKIAAQYVKEDSLDNSDIDIDISKGMVTLHGAVRTAGARTRAEEIAKATDGVKSVKNDLKVNPAVK
jgi:hyperosmotically inducible periplasmic protein